MPSTSMLNSVEIARIVNTTAYVPGHRPLLEALNSCYPSIQFSIAAETRCSWGMGVVVDSAGKHLAGLSEWVDEQLAAAGGDVKELWRRYKDAGYYRTEMTGESYYVVAPYGADPEEFYQLEFRCGLTKMLQPMFDPLNPPDHEGNLMFGSYWGLGAREIRCVPLHYEFERLTNISQFLMDLAEVKRAEYLTELPELEKEVVRVVRGNEQVKVIPVLEMYPSLREYRMPNEYRFFEDWHESSAGLNGRRICDHWYMATVDLTDPQGARHMMMIPQWVMADGGLDLPLIRPNWDASPWGVMEALQQFDKLAG